MWKNKKTLGKQEICTRKKFLNPWKKRGDGETGVIGEYEKWWKRCNIITTYNNNKLNYKSLL